MIWNPGDDDDINEGGDGNDTAEVNGGGGGEQFTVKPSAVAGRVAFDRTGTPTPFSVDIGTTENLLLNAAAGDDRIKGAAGLAGLIKSTLNGDDGNDRITGTDGEDRLSGGKGLDLINARDKAEDTVDCGGGLDLAIVDRRDFLRGCEIVFGGAAARQGRRQGGHVRRRQRRGDAALRQATKRCKGKVRGCARRQDARRREVPDGSRQEEGPSVSSSRGAACASRRTRLRAKLVIDAVDANGNGWRSTARVTVAD